LWGLNLCLGMALNGGVSGTSLRGPTLPCSGRGTGGSDRGHKRTGADATARRHRPSKRVRRRQAPASVLMGV
jgi:hypothetical protein